MNYIQQINLMWSLIEQGIISGPESVMYMYLLHTSNKLNWKNPFNQSNALICALLNISEKSLIKYRNNLKQAGLIDFESGSTKRINTQYTLIDYCKIYSPTGSQSGNPMDSLSNSPPGSLMGGNRSDYNKHKQNKTKIKVLSLPFPTDLFKEKWQEYKEWKKAEKKGSYKSVSGEQKALNSLNEIAKGNEAIAIKIIDKAMANGWQGLFELKPHEMPADNPETTPAWHHY